MSHQPQAPNSDLVPSLRSLRPISCITSSTNRSQGPSSSFPVTYLSPPPSTTAETSVFSRQDHPQKTQHANAACVQASGTARFFRIRATLNQPPEEAPKPVQNVGLTGSQSPFLLSITTSPFNNISELLCVQAASFTLHRISSDAHRLRHYSHPSPDSPAHPSFDHEHCRVHRNLLLFF